jgi:hypothetical protein
MRKVQGSRIEIGITRSAELGKARPAKFKN